MSTFEYELNIYSKGDNVPFVRYPVSEINKIWFIYPNSKDCMLCIKVGLFSTSYDSYRLCRYDFKFELVKTHEI